jgi:hypothetical protein
MRCGGLESSYLAKGQSAIEDGSDFSRDPASRTTCSIYIFQSSFAPLDGGDQSTAVETDAPGVGPGHSGKTGYSG